MPKLTIERPETVQMRVEPDLHEALRQMAAGNAMSKSEMARALLRRGMRAVAEEDNTAGRYGPP